MKQVITIILLGAMSFGLNGQTKDVTAFSRSYELESQEKYDESIQTLEAISEKDYTVHIRLGWLYYSKGEFIQSKTHYNLALKISNQSIEGYLGLAYPVAAMGNWKELTEVYQKILAIDPQNYTANYRLAYLYHYTLKDDEKALKYITKLQKLYPFDGDVSYLLASIHVKLGNITEAKEAILVALKYNPTSSSAKSLYESVK